MKLFRSAQWALIAALLIAVVGGSGTTAGAQSWNNNGDQNGNQTGNQGGQSNYGTLAPVLECLATNRDSTGTVTGYTAVFGYSGVPAGGVTVPVGTSNTIIGYSWTGTQVTSFDYGSNGRTVGAMRLTFKSGGIMWLLNGSAAVAQVGSSKDCSPPAQVPEGPAGLLALSGLAAAGVGTVLVIRRRHNDPAAA